MTQKFRLLVGAAVGLVAAVSLNSCAYPYYGTAVGATYSSGGTTAFISTGDPAWGYDPYSYSYYHYGTRRYYDPYLYGFYPVGYRPVAVYGVPHPYGWRPGVRYIRPPARVSYHYLDHHYDRVGAYRNSGYGWAHQVRQGGGHANDNHSYGRTNYDAQLNKNARPPASNSNVIKQSAENSGAVKNSSSMRQGGNSKMKSPQTDHSRQAQHPTNQNGKTKGDDPEEERKNRRSR